MRRVILWLFFLALIAALGLTLLTVGSWVAQVAQLAALVLLIIILLDRVFGVFKARRRKVPPSQVAEIEMLYFRSVRELLNEYPNLVQVSNDLQRILSIDPRYKNARHFLNRVFYLQSEGRVSDSSSSFTPSRTSVEFVKLQDRLIDPDPDVRKAVVMELIQYGEIAVDPLIALLMDEDADVRVHAATALGWIGRHHAVQPLLVALNDSNPYVRRYAARAMCWVVNESAIEGLIASLHDDDNYVRRYAARALGWSQDRRAIRPLLELVVREENSDVREYALTALDDLGEPRPRIERPVELVE